MTATEVANELTSGQNKLPDPTVLKELNIVLYSCFAGMQKKKEKQKPDPSLVAALAKTLREKGYTDVSVKGQVGVSFGFEGVGTRSTKGTGEMAAHLKPWGEYLNEKLVGEFSELDSGKTAKWPFPSGGKSETPVRQFKQPDELLRGANKDPSKMSVEDKAAEITKILKPFWLRAKTDFSGNLAPLDEFAHACTKQTTYGVKWLRVVGTK